MITHISINCYIDFLLHLYMGSEDFLEVKAIDTLIGRCPVPIEKIVHAGSAHGGTVPLK